MRKWLLASVLLISLGVAACGTPDDPAKALISACNAAAAAENSLAGFVRAGKVPQSAFPAIRQAQAPIRTFCDPTAPVPSDFVSTANLIVAATAKLLEYQR